MASNSSVFIVDGKGRKLTCKEAAGICGCNDHQVRHYIKARGAKTITDIIKIRKALKKGGNMALHKKKTFLTKYGVMTLDEIHARHISRDIITKPALNSRINTHGPESDELWEPKKNNGCPGKSRGVRKKVCSDMLYRICSDCGIPNPIDVYVRVDYGDGRTTKCNTCRNRDARDRYKNKEFLSPTKNTFTVELGTIVISSGRKYEVAEHLDHGLERSRTNKGSKAEITGFRIMGNGQIMRRTFVNLGSNWNRVSP